MVRAGARAVLEQAGARQIFRLALAHLYRRLGLAVSTWRARLSLWLWGASVARRLRVYSAGSISIGDQVTLISGLPNPVGADRRLCFRVGPGARLTVHDGCGISNGTLVCMQHVEILPQTCIGEGCEVYDSDLHAVEAAARERGGPKAKGPIIIGPKAFIGAWTIVLKNVRIGEGAMVGAGSVVTHDIPPYELWAGVPARRIRALEQPGGLADESPSSCAS
jgi:acetyltransferase-like isoleucine patch superfamily enzyme